METMLSPVLDKPYYDLPVRSNVEKEVIESPITSYFGVQIANALEQANYPLRYYTEYETELKLLKSKIEFRNEFEILDYISEDHNIITFIKQAVAEISRYFNEPVLVLELIEDKEAHKFDYLTLFVLTNLSVSEAREKLAKVNENWLYPNFPITKGKLNIYLEYV